MANQDTFESAVTTSRSSALIRAPRGTTLSCRGWQQEAALRMLMNSLDPDVAERSQDSIDSGAVDKVVHDEPSYQAIVAALKQLANDETLVVQSGRLAGVFRTHESAPRVLLLNSNPICDEALGSKLDMDDRLGLIRFGQLAAANWMSLGAQGTLAATYETFALAAQDHFAGDLGGKLVVSGGMGRIGGVQPLTATMNGAAFLGIDVDGERIKRCIRSGYCDICVNSLDEAIRILKNAVRKKQGVSVGLVGNCAEILPEFARRGILPDLLTDQTSAHDPLNGYVPAGLSLEAAAELRLRSPGEYLKRSYESIALHVTAMLELQKLGAVAFSFGNGIRKVAFEHGSVKDAFRIPDFASAYLRPQIKTGREPIRWVALSGAPADIYRIDDLVLELFPDNSTLDRWIRMAKKFVKFEGLPARVCWLGREERALFGERVNDLVVKGDLKAPIAIGRDREDSDSGTSDLCNIERIKARSDSAPDPHMFTALLAAASDSTWASFEQIGAVGTCASLASGQVAVADGAPEMAKRLNRVLTNNPKI
jgi:urocanate hydratase